MIYYKDTKGGIHILEREDDAHLLPAGAIKISAKDAETLLKPPISQAREAAWERIKSERKRREDGGVLVDGSWMHTDTDSRTLYISLEAKVQRANLSASTVLHPAWKTMDGSKRPMTVAFLRQTLDAGAVYISAVYDVAEAHKDAMLASADPAAYDFSKGWPPMFGEA